MYESKWIVRGDPILRPPRSPDLSPVDFFDFARMKESVYSTPAVDQMDLSARIAELSAVTQKNANVFEKVR